jgi:hypothetical protein
VESPGVEGKMTVEMRKKGAEKTGQVSKIEEAEKR